MSPSPRPTGTDNPNGNVYFMSSPVRNRDEYPQSGGPSLPGGGGGGTFDRMEARVSALEENFKTIDGKLDKLIESMSDFRRGTEVRLASIEGELKSKASAADLAEVKGRLSNLPTTIQLLGFVVATFVAAGILKYFVP